MDDNFAAPAPGRRANGLGALALALGLSVLTAAGASGAWTVSRMWLLHGEVKAGIEAYDTVFDPIEVQGGKLRALGPRRPEERGSESCFVVDPEGAVAESDLASCRRAILVREDRIVDIQPFQRREILIGELQTALGVGDFRVDSAGLAAVWGRWWWALDGVLVIGGAIAACFAWIGLASRAALLGFGLKLAAWRRPFAQAYATALLAALPVHLLLFAFRSFVWDTGVILHNLAALVITAPIAGLVWFLSGRAAADDPAR